VGVLKAFWLGVPKAREIKKVTTSQDDDFVGGLKKNTGFNRLRKNVEQRAKTVPSAAEADSS
jgi:hypothetical protein